MESAWVVLLAHLDDVLGLRVGLATMLSAERSEAISALRQRHFFCGRFSIALGAAWMCINAVAIVAG